MADNVTLSAGTADGAVIATDDATGVHHQYVKVEFGPDNTQTPVTTTVGLPTDPLDRAARDCGKVDIAAFDVALPAGTNNIGDVDVLSVVPGVGATNLGKAQDTAVGATDTGVGMLAKQLATPANVAGTDGDFEFIQMSAGRLWVSATVDAALPAGTNGIGKLTANSGVDIGDVDVLSIAAGDNNIGNVDVVTLPAVTNGGTFAVQESGAALTALQLIDNASIADDAAFTPATTGIRMAGFFADEASTDSVDEGDGGAARMTLDRKLITAPQPHTTGGLSIFRTLDADETEEEVKATAGCIYGMWITNTATTTTFVKLYNLTAANTTVGTSTPLITIGIPGNASDDVSGVFNAGGMGITFDTAISVAAVTEAADNGTTAPGANSCIVNIFFK